mmetsp:Transcript_50540/g.128438  ORF Transcript_50540/g.128438 Transcript_50540/m.128438 type:complete len:324 (-) Transcript_50540:365-1336(-)
MSKVDGALRIQRHVAARRWQAELAVAVFSAGGEALLVSSCTVPPPRRELHAPLRLSRLGIESLHAVRIGALQKGHDRHAAEKRADRGSDQGTQQKRAHGGLWAHPAALAESPEHADQKADHGARQGPKDDELNLKGKERQRADARDDGERCALGKATDDRIGVDALLEPTSVPDQLAIGDAVRREAPGAGLTEGGLLHGRLRPRGVEEAVGAQRWAAVGPTIDIAIHALAPDRRAVAEIQPVGSPVPRLEYSGAIVREVREEVPDPNVRREIPKLATVAAVEGHDAVVLPPTQRAGWLRRIHIQQDDALRGSHEGGVPPDALG